LFFKPFPGLVSKIISETGLDEDAAMERLYYFELYASLEIVQTKVWYYSVPKLYSLLEGEAQTGRLTLPEF
jgi:hypothetical protein